LTAGNGCATSYFYFSLGGIVLAEIPLGVKILAFLQISVGLLLLFAAAVIASLALNFFSIGLLVPFLPANIVLAALGFVFLGVGGGLWTLQSWAWYVNVFWYGILLLFSLWGLAYNALSQMVNIVVYGLICVYLWIEKDSFK